MVSCINCVIHDMNGHVHIHKNIKIQGKNRKHTIRDSWEWIRHGNYIIASGKEPQRTICSNVRHVTSFWRLGPMMIWSRKRERRGYLLLPHVLIFIAAAPNVPQPMVPTSRMRVYIVACTSATIVRADYVGLASQRYATGAVTNATNPYVKEYEVIFFVRNVSALPLMYWRNEAYPKIWPLLYWDSRW